MTGVGPMLAGGTGVAGGALAGGSGVTPSGGGWTPADLAGLELWLPVMSDPASVTTSGGFVTGVADASANGRDYINAGTGNNMAYGSRTINGFNVIDFPGSGNVRLVPASGWTLTEPYTIAFVLQADVVDYAGMVFSKVSGTLRGIRFSTAGSGSYSLGGDTQAMSWAFIGTAPRYIVNIFNGASPNSIIRADGAQVLTGGTNVSEIFAAHAIGASADGSGLQLNGALGELIIVDGVVSGDDLTNLEAFLAALSGT